MNKIRQFFNSSITRNILGQSTNTFDLGEVMDRHGILIVNLAKGKIGHERAALLGNFVISQIHLAAMHRTPYQHPQFDLFVDEARNFATDAIPEILSEARKYRLGLILAGQHLSQMDEKIQDAILGNVGTIAAFRVGPKDAKILAEEFGSKDGFTAFRARSIVELEAYHAYIQSSASSYPEKVALYDTPAPEYNFAAEIIKRSQDRYARKRNEVEEEIRKKYYSTFRVELDRKLGCGVQERKL